MRWSQTFIPTLKEAPKDAVVPSHILMLKAGYIRPLGSGAYTYLPLGYRVLRKCEAIVRDEMDKAGAVEIHMPALQPYELWEKTGRNLTMGANMFVVEDRWGAKTALGPTHEEVVTTLAKSFISSYKQLPVNIYQIQTKFRDEPRPRFGVLRSREFVMKDAYSFNKDLDCLDKSYKEMYAAYQRVFTRAGLRFVSVEAESGPIGGDSSHEFMVPSDTGEDTICIEESSGYAANLERCPCGPLPKIAAEAPAELKTVDTPNAKTIEQVAAFLKLAPNRFIKSLIWVATDAASKQTPFMALVRGDFDLNEAKVGKLFKDCRVEPADPKVVADVTNAPVGFAGPVGLKSPVAVYADHSVMSVVNGVTGANAVDRHITGVNPGRDFTPTAVADLRLAAPGDMEIKTGKPLSFKKGIEVGHVFRLGDKYTKPASLDMTYLDDANNKHTVLMGCYGIGVNRIMAAAIEQDGGHDENGIIWPQAIAPYEVLLCPLNMADEATVKASDEIYAACQAAGIEALYDDRPLRAGPKFMDADLIGIPLRITIGPKGLKDGEVELKRRNEKDSARVKVGEVVSALKAAIGVKS